MAGTRLFDGVLTEVMRKWGIGSNLVQVGERCGCFRCEVIRKTARHFICVVRRGDQTEVVGVTASGPPDRGYGTSGDKAGSYTDGGVAATEQEEMLAKIGTKAIPPAAVPFPALEERRRAAVVLKQPPVRFQTGKQIALTHVLDAQRGFGCRQHEGSIARFSSPLLQGW